MDTKQPQTEDQDLNLAGDAREKRPENLPPNINTSGSDVITNEDEEKKRESERQAWFQNAGNERLQIPNGYLNVAVLVVRWHRDVDSFKEGHDQEIRRLQDVFVNKFHYDYEEVQLDTSKKAQNTLNHAITTHINKHDGPHNLLIVFYTGHGQITEPGKRLEMSATSNAHRETWKYPPTAFWDEAEGPLLRSAEADVLAILDCCFASNAHKGHAEERRTYELLAAAPMDEPTIEPGPMSFTTALIESLEALKNEYQGKNFPVTKLLDKMNRSRSPPAMLWDRLHKHERNVQLAPLDRQKIKEETFKEKPPEKAWVKLRLSLEREKLSREQIEQLAREIPTACEKANISLRRMDWIKMESTANESTTFVPTLTGLVTASVAGRRLRRLSQGSPTNKRPRVEVDTPADRHGQSSGTNDRYLSLPSPDTPEMSD